MVPRYIQAGVKTAIEAETGYTLTANNGSVAISIAESGGYITFPAATSYTSGTYRYHITDTDGVVTEAGIFDIMPKLASGDGRTPNQILLAAIDAVLAGRASSNQLALTVDDKSIRYMSHAELLLLRAHYADLVDAEIAGLGGVDPNSYYSRFSKV